MTLKEFIDVIDVNPDCSFYIEPAKHWYLKEDILKEPTMWNWEITEITPRAIDGSEIFIDITVTSSSYETFIKNNQCPMCNGDGFIYRNSFDGDKVSSSDVWAQRYPCPFCNGVGFQNSNNIINK